MKTRAKRFVSALLAGVLCLSLLAGCASKKKELTRYSTVFYDVFDTVTQVIAYCESEEEFNTQMDALHADLITYNQLYDIYNDYPGVTNVKTINDNAGSAPVEVDDRILSMLELARQMYDLTGGKINIAMGSVLGIWHDHREAAAAFDARARRTHAIVGGPGIAGEFIFVGQARIERTFAVQRVSIAASQPQAAGVAQSRRRPPPGRHRSRLPAGSSDRRCAARIGRRTSAA